MELNWLEDFAELVATRNFSAAAASRNISQPAFSRRIQALEAWLGAELVDRRTSPIQLTAAGEVFTPRCQELVNEFYRLRVECRQNASPGSSVLTFATLQTIEMFFFPQWVKQLRDEMGTIQTHMRGGDLRDCVEALSLGNCDFAIMFDTPGGPSTLRSGPYKSIVIGHDRLIPVSGCDEDGSPCFQMDPDAPTPVPHLAYSWKDGYIGRLVSMIQGRQKRPARLQTVYQSSLAEGIKRMAIAGLGVAWLPQSSAAGALSDGRLVQIGTEEMTTDLDVCLYRRPSQLNPAAETFWKRLEG